MDTDLPLFETCLELYHAAYEQHGTSAFRAADLSWSHADAETDRVCRLAVAYGFLSTAGPRYRLTCPPDAPSEEWEEAFARRAETVRQALTTRSDDSSDGQREVITHRGDEYVSVRVTPSNDFDAVVAAVAGAPIDDADGVVLRGPGEHANEIQRFADRLGGASTSALPTELRKADSDVDGTNKDELEFRLFMREA